MILAFSIITLILTAIPVGMFFANLPLFCIQATGPPKSSSDKQVDDEDALQKVSVLIPARDEERGIRQCIDSALVSKRVIIQVIVLDDDSTDSTATIVNEIGESDQRVQMIHGAALPVGWNGKQHACMQLAAAARYDRFVFIDADVQLKPEALHRLIEYQKQAGVELLSTFPCQLTESWLESWLIPMMHFILLGYLPFARMRSNSDPSLAAGCGQLFLTTRDAYRQAGTHRAIKHSRHDGINLPRAYRSAGMMSDVIDGTELADCRMYRGASEVIRGVLKNATEGIANPRLILVFTVLLLGCSLFPVVAVTFSVIDDQPVAIAISTIALILCHVPRLVAAKRFRQSWFGAICHIPATLVFVLLQWVALTSHLLGHQFAWRGRIETRP